MACESNFNDFHFIFHNTFTNDGIKNVDLALPELFTARQKRKKKEINQKQINKNHPLPASISYDEKYCGYCFPSYPVNN